ncbi:MAG TPA: efflux transporter outer membrane subunit [Methylovirgula sp.]|nr:efflux transporter outer membrane subunit [Methylovirgula sp.]
MLTALRLTFGLSLACLLAGCEVGPNFIPPNPGLPQQSFLIHPHAPVEIASTSPAPPDPQWWAIFRDRELTALEDRVAAANLDVATATARLFESRFQRDVTGSSLFPNLNGNASYEREKASANGLLGLFGNQTPGTEASGAFGTGAGGAPGNLASVLSSPLSLWQYGFDASWELDVWGKVRREVEAADAQVALSANQRRDVLVSSLAELARDYMQLRGIQEQIKIAQDNLTTAKDILSVTQERQQKGLVTGLDVENAAAEVESIRAQIPDLQRQESEMINALSLLLAEPPGGLATELAAPRALPLRTPRLPVGIPSELARRRPDIREAEAQLHQATANIGVAIGDFYPSVALNASVGFQALDFVNLWKGSSLQYALGPSVTLPIFEGGRLRSTLELRDAQQQEAAIAYHETVLKAWHDVVNALIAYRTEQQRRLHLAAQVDHAGKALGLARDRYRDGVAQFITVLDAQRTLLSAQQQLAQSSTNVAVDIVSLYKALGGGWEETFPPQPVAPIPIKFP